MNRRNVVMICVLALAPTAFPSDGSWYAKQVAKAEEQYRKEDKSPLHYFLGTEFGCYQMPYAYWMRLKEHFGPFGWIRTMRNGGSKRFKADAELTYHLMNGPSNLVNVAKGVAELFRDRFGVEMQEAQQSGGSNCVWIAEGKSAPYDVLVKVCGPFETSSTNGEWRAYALQFEVANRWLGDNPKAQHFNPMRTKETWAEVFAPIRVEPERESIPDAWLYSPPKEPTTEERLARAIKEKKPSLVPRYAGFPGGITKDGVETKFTGCTEQEADFFSPDSNMFFRYCSPEEQNRMRDLASTPRRLKPRKPGEKRWHSVGNICGSVLPGDMVRWRSEKGDLLTGVVVSPDEEGEYVEAFKSKVRETERIVMAQKEDWLPTAASSNFIARTKDLCARLDQWRKDDNSLWKSADRRDEVKWTAAYKESFRRKVKRLSELRREYKPGVYENMTFSVIALRTKEFAALSVKRNEFQDMVRWQHGVNGAIEDLLRGIGRLCREGRVGSGGFLSEEECRELGLSGYERNLIENGHEWAQFGKGDAGMRIHWVQPPHVPLYSRDGVEIEWNPEAYVERVAGYTDSHAVDYVKAFSAYVEFATNVVAFSDAKLAAGFAKRIASELEPRQRVWLVRELCLAYGVRSLAPWRVYAEVGGIVSRNAEGKDAASELAWFRGVVDTQYFKGQMKRLADDAFRDWMRGKLDKFMDRKIKDADFDYVCNDEVLLGRNDYKVRKPHDGGDVLPHPFTLFGCTLGMVYDDLKSLSICTSGEKVLAWSTYPRIAPYFGQENVGVWLAPRAKVAYSLEIEWQDVKTKVDILARVKDIKADIEKRLGVTLGGLFFEVDGHVCDESKWRSAPSAYVKSRSVFGPIMIEICAACKDRGTSYVKLEIIDKVAEAIVEKERKENPLKYDREAERRRFERLKELSRRRKAMKDAKKAKQP